MYVCEECGAEDRPLALYEDASMCDDCASDYLESPHVRRKGMSLGGVVIAMVWVAA